MLASVSLEVGDELVERVLHVHMPDLCPDLILVCECRFLVLDLARLVLEGIPGEEESARGTVEGYGRRSPILGAVLDVEEVVAHGLVGELVQQRSVEVHGAVGDEENASRPRRIGYWLRKMRVSVRGDSRRS